MGKIEVIVQRAFSNWPKWNAEQNTVFIIGCVLLFLLLWFGYNLPLMEGIKKRYSRRQTISYGFLLIFLIIVFASTVFSRTSTGIRKANLEFLWSYKWGFEKHGSILVNEVILNLFLLTPVGILLPLANRKPSLIKVILFSGMVSVAIESLQYFLCRGLAETDDVFHNVIGAMGGYFVWKTITSFYRIYRGILEKKA